MKNQIIFWIMAIVITLSSVIYQRKTGPTYPVKGSIEIAGQAVNYKLLRSHNSTDDAVIRIETNGADISGEYDFRRFRSHDEWQMLPMQKVNGALEASIPKQPPAGKVMYRVRLVDGENTRHELTEEPVIIRFKGPVPATVLIPHILLMFTSMFFANRAGIEALARHERQFKYALITMLTLGLGGLLMGPIVQKYAFGAYWTGWPFGHDLTDNKSAVAFIMWAVAIWRLKKTPETAWRWVVIAAIVQLAVYLIPHSVLGSELDYTAMES